MSNDFQVGDRVWDFRLGWGTVKEIAPDDWPVGVQFDGTCYCEWFSADGRFTRASARTRTLFFEEIPIPESATKRPREPKPGEWVAASDAGYRWMIAKFIKKEDGRYACEEPNGEVFKWNKVRSLASFLGM